MHRYRRRFWFESAASAIAVAAGVLTAGWPDWIERATGVSPDGASGSLEMVITLVLAIAALTLACVAYRERRGRSSRGLHSESTAQVPSV